VSYYDLGENWRTMGNKINTDNHHDVCAWVEQKQTEGVLKPCTHLSVLSFAGNVEYFVPDCEKRSFYWKTPAQTVGGERANLRFQLNENIISCPKKCMDFESARKRAFFDGLTRCTRPLNKLWAPFHWFRSLSWQVQLAILAVLLVALMPRLIPPLIQLLQALHGPGK
jgi:hypothetical protein